MYPWKWFNLNLISHKIACSPSPPLRFYTHSLQTMLAKCHLRGRNPCPGLSGGCNAPRAIVPTAGNVVHIAAHFFIPRLTSSWEGHTNARTHMQSWERSPWAAENRRSSSAASARDETNLCRPSSASHPNQRRTTWEQLLEARAGWETPQAQVPAASRPAEKTTQMVIFLSNISTWCVELFSVEPQAQSCSSCCLPPAVTQIDSSNAPVGAVWLIDSIFLCRPFELIKLTISTVLRGKQLINSYLLSGWRLMRLFVFFLLYTCGLFFFLPN